MKDQAVEATIAHVANASAKAGVGTIVLGWLTLNDLALIVGILIAVAGFAVNFYYKRKADLRDAALHAKLMSKGD